MDQAGFRPRTLKSVKSDPLDWSTSFWDKILSLKEQKMFEIAQPVSNPVILL